MVIFLSTNWSVMCKWECSSFFLTICIQPVKPQFLVLFLPCLSAFLALPHLLSSSSTFSSHAQSMNTEQAVTSKTRNHVFRGKFSLQSKNLRWPWFANVIKLKFLFWSHSNNFKINLLITLKQTIFMHRTKY